jgi:nitrite reductase (NO-forming)
MINMLALFMFVLAAAIPDAGSAADATPRGHDHLAQTGKPRTPAAAPSAPKLAKKSPAAEYTPNVRYRLRTELAEGKMAFVGVGGDIEGLVNPTLRATTVTLSRSVSSTTTVSSTMWSSPSSTRPPIA